MKKNKRKFTTEDSFMLQTASTLQALFSENIADFTALDATLNPSFAADWLLQISNAMQFVQHSQLKNILGQKKAEVKTIMADCRTKYKEVKFFAAKAFDNAPKHLEAFGTKQFANARLKPNYMIGFMDELNAACTKFDSELLAAGMSQTKLDQVATLRDLLFEAHTAQETCAREHAITTQQRIKLLNECFLTMNLVSKAAMLVYEHDFARRKMYVFQVSKTNKPKLEV